MKRVLISLLVVAALVGCSKNETEDAIHQGRSSSINLSANVQATIQSRAAVSGTTFPASTDNVFRLTAFSGAAAPTTDWSATPYLNNIQVNSGAASALTLAPEQHYPTNGNKVYFYGYAPEATSLTPGTASAAPIAAYTMTGQQDIMAAQETAGITLVSSGTQPQPTLAFTHKLMQVRFKIVKDASFEAGKKVSEITVKGVKTSAKLDIATGTLTFDDAADKTLSLPITAGIKDEITTDGVEMDSGVMLEPVGTNITLKVTADNVVYDDIKVALTGTNNGKAGTSHLITLVFKRASITPKATITDWATPVDKDVDVDGEGLTPSSPAIGHLRDNGIIYHVNGLNYKIMSVVEAPIKKSWAAKDTNVIGSATPAATSVV